MKTTTAQPVWTALPASLPSTTVSSRWTTCRGLASLLALTGTGALDLVKETADTRFNVRVKAGWEGEGQLVEFLKETPIPLRVYGKWQELNYSLQVDQILRKHLQDEAKRRLNDWADRNKESQSGKDVKKLLDKL